MKAWLIALVSVGAGIAAGVCSAWIGLRSVEDRFATGAAAEPRRAEDEAKSGPSGAPKVVVVGGDKFDFGVMKHDVKQTRAFRLKNQGDAPLELNFKSVSCGMCLKTEFSHARVMPGQTAEASVEWTTRKSDSEFEEFLELTTNDPQRRIVRLTIRGVVIQSFRAKPAEFSFGSLSANAAATAKVRIFAFHTNRFAILAHKFANADIAELFDARIESLTPEELREEPLAKSGAAVLVTIKPGLPQGLINQSIRLTTNSESKEVIDLPIEGAVESDISLVGAGRFDSKRNILVIGSVARDDGAKASLRLVVRGPHREGVRFQIGRVDPVDVLRASIGARLEVGGGPVQYPLTIEVLKGARPINCLGEDPEGNGKVFIDTTHPQVKQILVYVRFAVQG